MRLSVSGKPSPSANTSCLSIHSSQSTLITSGKAMSAASQEEAPATRSEEVPSRPASPHDDGDEEGDAEYGQTSTYAGGQDDGASSASDSNDEDDEEGAEGFGPAAQVDDEELEALRKEAEAEGGGGTESLGRGKRRRGAADAGPEADKKR